MAGSTGEVMAAAHRAIILALGASEFQTQPKAWGKVCCAQVTDECHLVGTAEQNLHANMEADLSVRARQGSRPCCAPRDTDTTAEGAPAPTVRVGTTSVFFFSNVEWEQREKCSKEIFMRKGMQCERISQM